MSAGRNPNSPSNLQTLQNYRNIATPASVDLASKIMTYLY
jgi:hypothetical protein